MIFSNRYQAKKLITVPSASSYLNSLGKYARSIRSIKKKDGSIMIKYHTNIDRVIDIDSKIFVYMGAIKGFAILKAKTIEKNWMFKNVKSIVFS